jgi:hypothetical protein
MAALCQEFDQYCLNKSQIFPHLKYHKQSSLNICLSEEGEVHMNERYSYLLRNKELALEMDSAIFK